jgi:hypothetical protein
VRLTRRALLLGAGTALVGASARAGELVYRDWRIDTDAVHGELSAAQVKSLQAQVDLVESLAVKPEIKAFFRRVEVKADPSTLGFSAFYRSRSRRGAATFHRIHLGIQPQPPDSPVLLSMLLVAYLDERLPQGKNNKQLQQYYDDARQSGAFSNRAKMFEDPPEFFGVCGAVVLWGRAPIEPFERARVKQTLPDFYGWVVKEFYPDGAAP